VPPLGEISIFLSTILIQGGESPSSISSSRPQQVSFLEHEKQVKLLCLTHETSLKSKDAEIEQLKKDILSKSHNLVCLSARAVLQFNWQF
jgi:hypothetical protein